MAKNLHIIMPMAGEGRRFKEMGIETPKPLIKFNGNPIFIESLNSIFKFDDMLFVDYDKYSTKIKITFIVRQELVNEYDFNNEIKSEFLKYGIDANIIAITYTTRGALETVSLAEPYIDKANDCLLVMDCDMSFYCPSYLNEIKRELEYDDSHPMLMSFYSRFPGYSFAEVEQNGNCYYATNVVEKNPISTHAIAGCYFLGDANRFFKCYKKVVKDFESGKLKSKELYLSLIYNYLIKDIGFKDCVKLIDMNLHNDSLLSFNTPKEFENSLNGKNIWDD